MEADDYRTTFELEGHNWWFVGTRDIWARLLAWQPDRARPASGPAARVLDVGCGTGRNLEHLAPLGPTVGVDLSPLALDRCRERGLDPLVQGRGEALPFADGTFGAVTAIGVVEHIEDDAGAVAEWARVLEPGGRLVLLTSSYRWMWSGHDVSNHHVRRYRTGEVERLLRDAGLEPVRVSYITCFLFPAIAAIRVLERVRRRGREIAPHKDTGEVPAPVNRLLAGLLRLEGRLLLRRPLPFGVSMVARADKPTSRRPTSGVDVR